MRLLIVIIIICYSFPLLFDIVSLDSSVVTDFGPNFLILRYSYYLSFVYKYVQIRCII